MPELPLDVAAIVKLAERGRKAIREFEDEGVRRPSPRLYVTESRAELAVVAAARLAAHAGAIGLVADVRRWAYASPTGEDPMSIVHTLIYALLVCVDEGFDRDRLEPLLATLEDWQVAKIALALDPEQARDLELLQRLADDRRAEVAAAACERLGPRRAWCWHAGIFEHDPIAAHADEPAVVDALTRARAALGREHPAAKPSEAAELCSAVDELPPALAMPLLEAGLLAFPSCNSRFAASKFEQGEGLVVRLHTLGGTDAVLRAVDHLVEAHGDPEQAFLRVASWCALLPEPARVDLAVRVLPWVDVEPGGDIVHGDAGKPRGAARLVAAVWPRTRAPLPLIEWLDGGDRYALSSHILESAIDDCAIGSEPDADRLFELALAHPRLPDKLSKLFAGLGDGVSLPRLAEMAEAAEGSSNERLRRWAFEQRIGRLAPTEPAARDALAQTWLDDPDRRKAIMGSSSCRARLLPWLRRRLRAGELTHEEANITMTTIGELYGGVVEPVSPGYGRPHWTNELEAAEARAQARAKLGAWIDQPSGPPASEEWASLRALTRHALQDKGHAWRVLAVLPLGPWTDEDLALLDLLEGRAMPTDPLGPLMLRHYQDLLESARPPDASARAQRMLDAWRSHSDDRRVSLGGLQRLAEGTDDAADGEAPSRPSTTSDWMDEEERDA